MSLTPPPIPLLVPLKRMKIWIRYRQKLCAYKYYRAGMEPDTREVRTLAPSTSLGTRQDVMNDIVGIMVDGRVYVDDEPYWRGLLKPGKTYWAVYLLRPSSELPYHIRAWDTIFRTPCIALEDVPKRTLYYTRSASRARLVQAGLLEPIPGGGSVKTYRRKSFEYGDENEARLRAERLRTTDKSKKG